MRIACIHLPQFPLQVVVRAAEHRAGSAIAVVAAQSSGRGNGSPTVIACSRAAHALGVRIGMSGHTARSMAPDELEVVPVDRSAEVEVATAIAEGLLAISPRVDRGGEPTGTHHALYCEVPSKMRGAAFGHRIVTMMERLGVRARIGIADDVFTAWVAASQLAASAVVDAARDGRRHNDTSPADVTTVPRGGSAVFLSAMPLSLLPMPSEVQHLLGTLGVRTLGQFADLPRPSAARAWDTDFQAMARGEGGTRLTLFVPKRDLHSQATKLQEQVALRDLSGVGAGLSRLADRVMVRAAGRGIAISARLVIERPVAHDVQLVHGANAQRIEIVVQATAGVGYRDAAELADEIGRHVGDRVSERADGAVTTMTLLVDVVSVANDGPVDHVADGTVHEFVADAASAPVAAPSIASRLPGAGVAPALAQTGLPWARPRSLSTPAAFVAAATTRTRVAVAADAEPFRLTRQDEDVVPTRTVGGRPIHRRTQRGKHRPRHVVGAQARLFGGLD